MREGAEAEADAREAQRAAGLVSSVAAFGYPLAALTFHWKEHPALPFAVAAALAWTGVVLTRATARLPRRASLAVFAVVTWAGQLAGLFHNEAMAQGGSPFMPFSGQKMAVLLVALLAPSARLGAMLIGTLTLQPIVQFFLWPPSVRDLTPPVEPWQTLVMSAVSLGVLAAQRRQVAVQRSLAAARTVRTWIERVARLSVAVRDLANSPLQTLSIGLSLVRQGHERADRSVQEMDGAVARLRRINDALRPLDRFVEWRPGDLSLDSLTIIEQQVRHSAGAQEARSPPRPPTAGVGDPDHEARRAVRLMSWALAAGSLIAVALAAWQGHPVWVWLMLACVGAMGIGLSLVFPKLRRRASLAFFSLESLCGLVAVWIGDEALAATGRMFVPFNGTRVFVLLIALLSPSGWLGGAIIGLFSFQPIVQSSLWTPEVRESIPDLEPWLTLGLSATSLALLIARRRHAALLRERAHAEAEQVWLGRVARLSFLVLDLTRPPLRTLLLETEAVRRQHDGLAEVLARMDRAVERLHRLNEALVPLDPLRGWQPAEVSFDALAHLEQAVRDTLPSPAHAA